VLSAHQGAGEPLRPMPLEITRCLHVPGADLAPAPPVRRGRGRVVAVDTTWSNGQACHSCDRRRLMAASGCRRRRQGGHLGRLRPPVERGDFPFFLSPWQTSHCS
jgi:hypothetical protein